MTVHTLQVNGTRGEITPLMHARVDTDFYQAGYALARNVVVTRYGAVTRSPGTLFDGQTKNADRPSRMMPFEFSEEQVYALEFGHGYIRFWTPEGIVVSGGVPYEVATPFAQEYLPNLQIVQSGDTLYIFIKGYRVHVLRRLAETNWTLSIYKPKDGPYGKVNDTATTLSLQGYNSFTPKMTSNSAPSGTVTSSEGGTVAFHVFDKDSATDVQLSTGTAGWVMYDRGVGGGIIDSYWVQSSKRGDRVQDMFTQWTIRGSNDGVSFTTLDTRTGQTAWGAGEKRFYEFANFAPYRYIRFEFDGGGGDDYVNTSAAEIAFNLTASSQAPLGLVASSTAGINNGAGFSSADIGRSIRIMGSDGRWRWCEITGIQTPLIAEVKVHGHALPDLSPFVNWAMGAWSDLEGWPSTGALFEDRLIMAGSPSDPVGVWGSVIGAYDSFRQSTPLQDDDGISIRLTGGRMNLIQWLAESGALLAGTGGSLRSIGSRDNSSGPLSATNIRQRAETAVGASSARPAEVENVVLFIDRAKQRMYEAAYDFQADGYLAREVSTLNEHLFISGIEQVAFMSTPHKVMWCRRKDGKMVAFTYDREQKVVGGTLVDFGGFVEDVMTMTGRNGVDVWLTVRRFVNGQNRRYIERLAPFYRSAAGGLPIYAASAVARTGAPTASIGGLGHLANLTVGVWADGRDIGDAVVSAGGVATLPFGLTGSNIVIGTRMPWRMQTLRLPQIGNQDGSGLGRKVRVVNASIDMFDTAGITAGTLSEEYPLRFEDEAEDNPDTPEQLRTGMYKMPADDSWQNDGVFVIGGDKLYSATIRGISLDVDGEP